MSGRYKIGTNPMNYSLLFMSFFMIYIRVYAGVVFSDLPKPKGSLTIQLTGPDHPVKFRRPAEFHLRLANNTDAPMELPMRPAGDNREINSCVLWYHSDLATQKLATRGNPFFRGREQLMILPAKGTLVIRLPDKLLPLGKHEISVSYKLKDQDVRSNPVTVSVVEKPLARNEEVLLIQESLEMMMLFRSEQYGEDPWLKEIVENKVVIGGSYLVPELKALLTFPQGRLPAVEMLGLIADKERAAKIGYIRDTSAADLVIERIGKESDAPVKAALLKIVGKFFDVLDQPQRQKLEKSGLVQLSHQDAGVRVQSALMLLEWFPKRLSSVEKALAKPAFCDDSGRKQIADTLAKVKAKLPQ